MKHSTGKWFSTSWTILILILGISSNLCAQKKRQCPDLSNQEEKVAGKERAMKLQEGYLLIEIEDQKKQLDLLEDYLQREDLSTVRKDRFANEKAKREEEIATWRKFMVEAFSENYSFNEVLFYHKSDRDSLKAIEKPWVNGEGEHYAQSIEWSREYLILTPGQTKNQGLEAYVLLTPDRKLVCPPFPTYFRLNSFISIFKWGDKEKIHQTTRLAEKVHQSFLKARYPDQR